MDSWVKLYRGLLSNDLLVDRVALQIFIYLLLKCNEKGQVRVSRYKTSAFLDLKPETFRSGLARLVRDERITTTSTNGYTVVMISNYKTYQQPNTRPNTKSTPTRHQPDTTIYNNRIEKNKGDRFKIKPPTDHIPYVPPQNSDPHPI